MSLNQGTDGQAESPRGSDGAVIFCVTSGKGGVGKTSLSVNLAVAFSKRGHRTIVVDADLGLANTHILTGLRPEKTLSDYLEGRAALTEVIMTSEEGAKFISGGSGVREMANLDDAGRKKILDAVLELRPFCDVIILDTAAGISRSVTDFVSISDHSLVVTTPDFAAIADAYGIIKTMVQEQHKALMHLVVNRVQSPDEAKQVFEKLKDCSARFLGFELNWLGLVPEDTVVEAAMTRRTPFCEAHPDSVAARYVTRVVTSLERLLPAATTPKTS